MMIQPSSPAVASGALETALAPPTNLHPSLALYPRGGKGEDGDGAREGLWDCLGYKSDHGRVSFLSPLLTGHQ